MGDSAATKMEEWFPPHILLTAVFQGALNGGAFEISSCMSGDVFPSFLSGAHIKLDEVMFIER